MPSRRLPLPLPLPLLALAAALVLSLPTRAALAQGGDVYVDVGRGPVKVHVPASYDPAVPTPLVVNLHGYAGTSEGHEAYTRFEPLSEEFGFLYATPDGSRDLFGLQYWNATDYCCDFFGSDVDDSGYLLDLVHAIEARANVDPDRVYFTGYSNGGFMSYRMACDHSETIAAVASLAGATWSDAGDCAPVSPVHVLQIHGTRDDVIRFRGDCSFQACYPSAVASVAQWVGFGGCDRVLDTSPPNLDLDFLLPGDETVVTRVDSGCLPNGSGELWVIVGGSHGPALRSDFAREVVRFFYDHPKER